jgi:hypothetical protein
MIKCFKLPVIQVSTAFEGFLRGGLLVKNRVLSRRKISIFTIVNIVKQAGGNTRKRDIHILCQFVNKSKKRGVWWILKRD